MSEPGVDLIACFEPLVGPAGLISQPDVRRSYEVGARDEGGRAALVVRPATTAEVSAVVASCVRHRLRVIPQGGNTGLVGASTPDPSGRQVVLSLDRLRAPLEVDPVNRSVVAGAGVRLSALNDALGSHGLFLPIDLGADPTVGGMVATNTGGARFIRYGDMRRQVLGLQVVLADEAGSVLDLRGGLRKDNTGLDLRQLFLGGGGSFGVVTRVELEAQCKPRQSAAALVLLEDADAALPLLAHVEREAGELLSAFEGMSGEALARTLAHRPSLRNPFPADPPPYAVLVEFSSARAARAGETPVESVLEACISDWWEQGGSAGLDALFGRPEDLWAIRHSLSEGLRASGRIVGFDLAFRRSRLPDFRRAMIARLATAFPEFAVCDFGHLGDGGIHFNLVCAPANWPTPTRLSALRTMVYDAAVREFGGSFSGEHGLGRTNLPYYRRYTPAPLRALSGDVQRAFTSAPLGVVDFADLGAAAPDPSEVER